MKSSETNFFVHPEQKKMIHRIGPAQADLLVVFGRDMSLSFDHRHTRATYSSAECLDEELRNMQPSDATTWELYMNEYLQVNKAKLDHMNQYRQRKFEKGEKM